MLQVPHAIDERIVAEEDGLQRQLLGAIGAHLGS